jgi:hypothetical protein
MEMSPDAIVRASLVPSTRPRRRVPAPAPVPLSSAPGKVGGGGGGGRRTPPRRAARAGAGAGAGAGAVELTANGANQRASVRQYRPIKRTTPRPSLSSAASASQRGGGGGEGSASRRGGPRRALAPSRHSSAVAERAAIAIDAGMSAERAAVLDAFVGWHAVVRVVRSQRWLSSSSSSSSSSSVSAQPRAAPATAEQRQQLSAVQVGLGPSAVAAGENVGGDDERTHSSSLSPPSLTSPRSPSTLRAELASLHRQVWWGGGGAGGGGGGSSLAVRSLAT